MFISRLRMQRRIVTGFDGGAGGDRRQGVVATRRWGILVPSALSVSMDTVPMDNSK